MKADSLHGSKREYLAPSDKMFCTAPMPTASISGVVPSLAVRGAKKSGKRDSEKKAAPNHEQQITNNK